MGNAKSKNDGIVVVGQPTGGLGNQLFVIATTYAYARKHNKRFLLREHWEDVSKDRPNYWNNILSFLKIGKYLVYDSQIRKIKDYTYLDVPYQEIPNFNHNILLKGYFQSEKYFKEYKNEICSLFKLPEYYNNIADLRLAKFKEETIVAVHIRRGDYMKHSDVYHLLSSDYYNRAKALLEEKLGFRPIYLYFSNDIEWVKENFNLEDKDEIIEEKKDYIEFAIMSKCHHFIIANSSFSWWSAYLSDTLDRILPKIVIAPEYWYKPEKYPDWSDIYPEGWLRVKDEYREEATVDLKGINSSFFLSIITCKKYESKRKLQNLENCPFKYKYFIGDKSLENFKEEEDIVYLPCPDNYESLPLKVYQMIKYVNEKYPENKFIIKCDDDITFNFEKFNNVKNLIYNKNLDYSGVVVKSKSYYATCHMGKTEDANLSKTKILIPKSIYCAGPCYILSKNSYTILLDKLLKNNTIFEDQSVGKCLEENKILPINFNMKLNGFYWE